MGKKCIICNEEAIYKIKDTSDYYCQDCAEENFADTSILIKVEEEALRLKEYIEQKLNSQQEGEFEDNSQE
jgi:hypothetical protein